MLLNYYFMKPVSLSWNLSQSFPMKIVTRLLFYEASIFIMEFKSKFPHEFSDGFKSRLFHTP